MKFGSLYLMLICILFTACSKNSSDPTAPSAPITLLSTASVYYGDTTSVPRYIDSLEYNEKNQVTKIDVYSGADITVTYTFAYNNDNNITEMHVRNVLAPASDYDYFFTYNVNGKPDSIKHMGAYESFYSVLNYNSNKQPVEVKTYYTSKTDTTLNYHCKFYRTTQIDSVTSDNLTANQRMRLILSAPKIDSKPILAINKAYILMWAVRSDFRTLFKSDMYEPSLFTLQFVNPDELLIKDCIRTYGDIEAVQPWTFQFTNTFSLNAAGAVRLYSNTYVSGQTTNYMHVRFNYMTR